MVSFKEKSLVIEIRTGTDPQEYYRESLSSLLQLMKMQNESFGGDLGRYNYYLLDMLQNMVEQDAPA
jgi:hypothetical protein